MTIATPSDVSEITLHLAGGKVPTRVLTAGHGDPVVFLHGAAGLAWAPPLDALATRYRVFAPEHPGASDPDALTHIRDLWDLTLFYDELLDVLELPSVALVGHSFGGMVAAEVAASSRRRIRKLALIAPIGLWRDDAPVPDVAGISPQKLLELSLADPRGPLADMMAAQTTDPAARFERDLRMASILHFIWPIPDKGLKRRIHRVNAPTLLIWGTEDKLVPPVYAGDFASLLSDAHVEMVGDAGHFPHLEAPEATSAILCDFLAGAA
jgi:pimeloyl-ACP methyl ester carboxylesterase